jgi:hypothetical protein
MIRISISGEALDDLADGFDFYEAREPGMGDYFASCLRGDIGGLKLTAGIHRVGYRDCHPLLSRISPMRSTIRSMAKT